jgi:outer membrane immunogenic protein
MKRILMAGVLALAAGSQAFAADLPPPMAPPPRAPAAYIPAPSPAYNWSGFYIGINGGYGFGNSDWTGPAFAAPSGNFSTSGAIGGGTVGVNYQWGQFVVGLEGDYDWQNVRGSLTSGVCAAASCDTASDWVATFRGRAGWAFDRVMVYATGGGAALNVQASQAALPWASSTELGWTAGGGVEAAITDNLTAKVEYLYVGGLPSLSCATASCGIPGPAAISFNESMVRVGLNYKFNF